MILPHFKPDKKGNKHPNNKLMLGFCGGLFGSHGVGKTTACKFVSEKYGFYWCDIAGVIEEAAKKLYHWNGTKDDDGLNALNKTCISGRKLNENYWLNIAIASIPKESSRVVFDNVFFTNEADFIKKHKGFIIKLNRPVYESVSLDFDVDYTIENNGNIAELEDNVAKLIKQMYNIERNGENL